MSDLIIIQEPKDLEGFELIDSNPLTKLRIYQYWLNKTQAAYEELLLDTTRENRPYQPKFAAIGCCRDLNLWGHSMGAGKTSMSLLMIQALYSPLKENRVGLIHIMVPDILAAQRWLEDSNRIPSLRGQIELIKNEVDILNASKPILLYSYDLPKLRSKVRKASNQTEDRLGDLIIDLVKPELTIIDEVHNIRVNTFRYNYVNLILSNSLKVLGLSGTISSGSLSELHNVANLIYGKHWPYKNVQQFSRIFGEKDRVKSHFLGEYRSDDSTTPTLQKLSRSRLPEYYSLAKRFIHRVRLDDPEVKCCIKLPKEKVHFIRVNAEAEQKEKFKSYILAHKEELKSAAISKDVRHKARALVLLNPLIRITNAWSRENEKKQTTLNIVKEAKGKVAIFCDLVSSARCIESYLKDNLESKSVVRLYAHDPEATPKDMSQDDRVQLINKLQFDDSVKVAVLSINLTAQAIDLTSVSDVIMFCLPWSSLKVMQALGRAVRSGNPHPVVNTYYIYQLGLIDEHKLNVVYQKIRGSNLLLDYEVDEQVSEGNVTPADVIEIMLKDY